MMVWWWVAASQVCSIYAWIESHATPLSYQRCIDAYYQFPTVFYQYHTKTEVTAQSMRAEPVHVHTVSRIVQYLYVNSSSLSNSNFLLVAR